MAKYLLIFNVTVAVGNASGDNSMEYEVECDPSELSRIINEKKTGLEANCAITCASTSRSAYFVSLRQVISLSE